MKPELLARIQEAHAIATEQLSLDPGDVRFVTVPSNILYATAADAIPGHWQHWSSGRDYWIQKKEHDAGHSRIYELVINAHPYLALLHESNEDILNTMVAAHVYGHTHLDGANVYFADTNPHMLDTIRTWAGRIESYEEEYGDLVVEEFIDKVLSLEPYATPDYKGKLFKAEQRKQRDIPGIFTPPPPEKPKKVFQPTGDLYGFLAQYAEGLEEWQRDILNIYRNRMVYFLPQIRCKVLHEGFASIVHRRVMEKITTTDDEWLEYSKINSGVMSPGARLNPYWLGHAILEAYEKEHGWDALLEMVATEDDASLVRNHLTEKLCEKLELYSFSFEREDRAWVVDEKGREWEHIRDAIARKFSNYRSPVLEVVDFDGQGKRALVIEHRFDGRRLNLRHADKALAAIADIWGQRVVLKTEALKGPIEGTAWAPRERDDIPDDKGNPTDWQFAGMEGDEE